jgi:tripartite-type tricarboxylate transporter receptor subunit TctC
MHRRSLAALAAVTLAAPRARAQAWAPDRPVRVIVTFSAGGAPDTLTRGLGDIIAPSLGQPIVVELRQGAGGNIGAEATARARPDGTTLWMASTGPLAVHHMIYQTLPFDAERDFSPIAFVAHSPNILVARPGLGERTLADLLALVRRQPGRITYGSAGVGTTQHLSGELLGVMANVEMTHVPYRGGAFAVQDLLGDRLDTSFSTTTAINLVREGKLVALATTGATRMAALPDVPTIAEQGVPGYASTAWYGLVGPAGLPREAVARLNALVNAATADAGYRDRMAEIGLYFDPGTPEAFADFILAERRKWTEVVARLPIAVRRG